jgi:hypothetical protein
VSFFRLLVEHSQRPYEPSPEHVLKRMLLPLCDHLTEIVTEGTKNDAWDAIEDFVSECHQLE